MKLYTIQMAQWRIIKGTRIELADVTFLSKNKLYKKLFAPPNFDMVKESKAGVLSNEAYIEVYDKFLKESSTKYEEDWINFLSEDPVALACYCGPMGFCHRHHLARFMTSFCRKHNLPIDYVGEITKDRLDELKLKPAL